MYYFRFLWSFDHAWISYCMHPCPWSAFNLKTCHIIEAPKKTNIEYIYYYLIIYYIFWWYTTFFHIDQETHFPRQHVGDQGFQEDWVVIVNLLPDCTIWRNHKVVPLRVSHQDVAVEPFSEQVEIPTSVRGWNLTKQCKRLDSPKFLNLNFGTEISTHLKGHTQDHPPSRNVASSTNSSCV